MCTYSMMLEWGKNQPWKNWTIPQIIPFIQTVEKAKEFDEATGQKDCEDPEKLLLLEGIIARLERLEGKPLDSALKEKLLGKLKEES